MHHPSLRIGRRGAAMLASAVLTAGVATALAGGALAEASLVYFCDRGRWTLRHVENLAFKSAMGATWVIAGLSLLAGLVSRCDVVFFPVDCVSHDAVLNVKAACRQIGRRFVPLRSAGLTTLLSALREPALS